MKALVVYESMYGNTATIAAVIAVALRSQGLEADARPVSEVAPITAAEVDLLVIGGPTHAHGMSRAGTRKTAVDDEKNTFAEPTVSPGLREWMDDLPAGNGRQAAAFDTRIDKPTFLTGSAAKGIARRLERHGYRLIGAESFLVTTKNLLLEGEVDRATTWAVGVAASSRTRTSTP